MGLEAGWNCHISLLGDPGTSSRGEEPGDAAGAGVSRPHSADSLLGGTEGEKDKDRLTVGRCKGEGLLSKQFLSLH